MTISHHRRLIIDGLAGSDARAKSLFSLLCAERLRNCWWAYEAQQGVHAPFFKWSNALFELLLETDLADSEIASMESAFEEIEAIVPTGGAPLFAQARSAAICLLAALDFLVDGNRLGISDPMNAVVDALDNYHYFTRRRLINDTSSPNDFPLLQTEMSRQLTDVIFVTQHDTMDPAVLSKYRCDNLQYVVPIAV